VRAVAPDGALAATTAGLRLDDALRGFLAEQGAKRMGQQEIWRLVGGSMRLRLTAQAVASLPHAAADVEPTRAFLDLRTQQLADWFGRLATAVGRPHRQPPPPLEPPALDGGDPDAGGPGQPHGPPTIWLREHLHHLSEHLSELVAPAAHMAEVRRRPWWR